MPISTPAADQPPRQLHIVGARRGIAGGMIVKHHDRRRAAERRLAKHLARLDAPTCSACRAPAPPSGSPDACVSSSTMPNCSTAAAAEPRQQIRRGLLRMCGSAAARSVACASVRRPSSSAATICAAARTADARRRATDRRRCSASDRAARRGPPAARWRPPARSRAGEPLPSTSATSSLSPSADAPWCRSFSRGRSSGDRSFIVSSERRRMTEIACRRCACLSRVLAAPLCRGAGRRRMRRSSRQRNAAGAGRDRRRPRRRRRSVRARRVRRRRRTR